MCITHRRHFLRYLSASPLLLAPLGLLTACKSSNWPEGMVEIKWDRDTCTRCSMVISDRRFAAQLRGGSENTAFKFDDIGCLLFWLRDKAEHYPWMADATTKMWVAELGSQGENVKWLDPVKAQFVTKTSPMGYNFGATAYPQAGSMDFHSMRQHILAKGK